MSLFKPYQYYSKSQIECKANELLMQMQATPNLFPRWPFDASRVADFLDIRVVWERISPDAKGAIAAKILPMERLIEINEDILEKPKGFEASTIAHEIGHWVLHINQDEADELIQQLELSLSMEDAERLFLCRSVGEKINQGFVKSQLDNVEWQAQYFASCLLMPRHILEEKRRRRNLTNWSHLYAMRDELGVTISNLTNRLKDLGWIYIPKGSKQIYPGKAASNEQIRLFD